MATDLDGTLLPSQWAVPARTRKVLARVHALGVPIVAVTARGPWSTKPVADEFGLRGAAEGVAIVLERLLSQGTFAP